MLLFHLLVLVRRVASLARFAQSVALDGGGEDDGRRSLVFDGGLVGSVDLLWVMAAALQFGQLFVGEVLD